MDESCLSQMRKKPLGMSPVISERGREQARMNTHAQN